MALWTIRPLRINIKSWPALLKGLIRPIGWLQLVWVLFENLAIIFIVAVLWSLAKIFLQLEVNGKSRIPFQGKVVFLLRHRSFIDPFIQERVLFWPQYLFMPWVFPVNVGKQKYFLEGIGKCFRWIVHWLRVIELPEREVVSGGRRSAVVKAVVEEMNSRADCMVPLYMTGTREEHGNKNLPPFMAGVGRIVAETSPQVVFVEISGSDDFWPKNKKPRLFSRPKVLVLISGPINAAASDTYLNRLIRNQDPKDSAQKVADYLRDLYWGWLVYHFTGDLESVEPPKADLICDDLVSMI